MNIGQALNLRGEADSYERQEAMWLLADIVKTGVLELKLRCMEQLSAEQEQTYLQGLMRLSQGEPLAYVMGSQPFWTLDLEVSADTLVPRPDTEILIETVLALDLPFSTSMVDMGTGTGAIALALASERPDWQVLATDIYHPTLDVARRNALKYGLDRVKFLCSAWFDVIPRQKFDLIVSNPPYIDAEDIHMQQLQHEPRRALVALEKGLSDLREIIVQGKRWLNPKGWMVLEHGYDQAQAVQSIFEAEQFSQIRTVQDYGNNDRVTLACWSGIEIK
ncbi:peptide chain release factor N(5)-glutamine methyltransferase [Acinetobacter sp. MD2(2019)]|uniref:peptide chain release factor N(5)-glutamine methyltransferase n=1 Tax=Acinetobacter sp. MD2(2019) TaxID=2605273 RepID=UPI002D1F09ED|nr:peptide chain release factor N(5)-glutamine methyltransferase [Acinetobacter sp. MD2(2019)]MEB3752905.1 peptide chain release factor N(5)-glutamine methyltransferase [Acinetobacter sp. MD2(2019)]